MRETMATMRETMAESPAKERQTASERRTSGGAKRTRRGIARGRSFDEHGMRKTLDAWFPPALRRRIAAIHRKHPAGFAQQGDGGELDSDLLQARLEKLHAAPRPGLVSRLLTACKRKMGLGGLHLDLHLSRSFSRLLRHETPRGDARQRLLRHQETLKAEETVTGPAPFKALLAS